ncbi:MAG: DNA (cytosine-5-)-methyltransferase [Burkholderiaceae bacterium]|nr:DNA (cytosine-5-)-methyltransferase [Burkholderiaceae bacterium]
MNHGSLFSGIGGFDLAAEWMGWVNVFHCEWMPFPRRVLHHYWPEALSYEDITKTDFSIHRGCIDVLSGGFPCQPYSAAGKRLGKEDERHLWPEMLRAIREIQPRWVVGENVFGLVTWNDGLVFEEVCSDLEAEGYEVQPFVLPACAVNAPHRRDRVWFVAHRDDKECNVWGSTSERTGKATEHWRDGVLGATARFGEERIVADAQSQQDIGGRSNRFHSKFAGTNVERVVADSACEGSRQFPSEDCGRPDRRLDDYGQIQPPSHTCDTELQGSVIDRSIGSQGETEGQGRQSSGSVCSQWEIFPTQPPICGGDDGLPTELDGITFPKWRAESIKAYGNAVVPQVVFQIFQAIAEYDSLESSVLDCDPATAPSSCSQSS